MSDPRRADRLDALRGAAIVWMVAYHFAFDLNHLRWLAPPQDFYRDPFWTWQRTAIVSLFLLCAGMGQALAAAGGQGWPRFWRRWAQVAGCALAVSAGSALMFPRSWISFGVLHGMALMLLLVRCAGALAPGRTAWLWPAGALALLLPHGLGFAALDNRLGNWLGLVTRKPITEDWVPVLPWLGVMLWGLAAGHWLRARRPPWLLGAAPGWSRPLRWLGQRPLTVYMLHQPLLLGALMLAGMARR
ncbi:heparan-alpha-glucosaminide N-acetyltransferase [Aquabacterium sp. OR-4]|uniref:heparan-alpha-glucosaminide N-acetyltransferase n=1 Tax=Aquabacterium sp. OR-4 TaxID=2978127 RepID=UPI0028C87F8C|nr:heparan-alpha-glucosaminide N-acetyltransferase [Aquabacterium sp. OR-4]MDT7834943.1 heparan-alpha-glucosaminide N-acetyltransferase [Aquabacterium sp. OR-4]